MGDLLKTLQHIADWQNQMIGAQEMQTAALKWAVANKSQLTPELIESFCSALAAHVVVLRASRPSAKEAA